MANDGVRGFTRVFGGDVGRVLANAKLTETALDGKLPIPIYLDSKGASRPDSAERRYTMQSRRTSPFRSIDCLGGMMPDSNAT
jgi:hypothetical protein